jgi:predicted DNA-binding protein (UPF0251 family)
MTLGAMVGQLVGMDVTLAEIERRVRVAAVRDAVDRENGHREHAALRLGVHRNTVTRILVAAGQRKRRRRKLGVKP